VLVWLRVAAAATAAFWCVLFFGFVDLSTLVAPGEFVGVVPLEVSWGAFFTFVVASAFVHVALHPRDRRPPAVQLLVAALALVVGAVAGEHAEPLVVAAVLASAGGLLLRGAHGRPTLRPSGPLLAVAVVGLPFWLAYAWSALASSRLALDDDVTVGVHHWPVQAACGLAVALLATLAGLWPAGRRLPATSAGLAATLLGVATLAYPDATGAMPHHLLGLGAVLFGLAVGLLALADGWRGDR
jgi:hypothetical protein